MEAYIYTSPLLLPMGDCRMKSGGAITSTRDTASFFSCRWSVKGRKYMNVWHMSSHTNQDGEQHLHTVYIAGK